MAAAKILVIEDNLADVEILRFALDQHGETYELQVMGDGETALRYVRESQTRASAQEPCVILLDLHLPRHDGLTVLDAIRLNPSLSHIQVIILTGGGTSPKDRSEIEAKGALLRQKPTGLPECIALCREILDMCKIEMTPPA